MTITLERVPAGGPAREELTALLPGYLRGLGVDAHYPYLPLYWTEAGRFPYLIREQAGPQASPWSGNCPTAAPSKWPSSACCPTSARGAWARRPRARCSPPIRAPGASASWQTTPARCASGARSRRRRPCSRRAKQMANGFWMLSLARRASDPRVRPDRAAPGCAASPRGDAGGHASHPRGRRPGPGGSRARQADHAGHRTGTMPGRGRRRPHRGLCDAGPRLFGHGFVSLIVVAAACRRQGVALRLLQAAVTACDTAKLSRRPTSPMSPPGA